LYTPFTSQPEILGADDAEIVGDRITEVRPIPRNFFTQETERRIGELGASLDRSVLSDAGPDPCLSRQRTLSSREDRAGLAQPGRRIKLHFIPPYCPHLNPIERLWGVMHRHVT
jgi:hypothetical protein